MKNNNKIDGETPRKQKLENSNSEKVRDFQRKTREEGNEEIWEHGYSMGINRGIEEAVATILKRFPNITPIGIERPTGNPDAGMEEREREYAEMEGMDD